MTAARRTSARKSFPSVASQSKKVEKLFAAALQAQRSARLAEAEQAYRRILDLDPHHGSALNNLGLIAPLGERAGLFRRALAANPHSADFNVNLAGALAQAADHDGAIAHYRQALSVRPGWVEVHYELGRQLQTRGALFEAAAAYERCVALKPDFLPAIFSLGCVYTLAEITLGSKDAAKAAITWFQRTLALAPDTELANFHLATLLENAGRYAEARPYRARVPRPLPLEVAAAADHRRTLLILCTPTAANTPFRNLLRGQHDSLISWQLDYATDEQQASLPPHDLAFYVVGNPDRDAECFDRAVRFARTSSRPLLNQPERVARTRRDMTPALLAGIPDVVVAPVVRLSRAEIEAPDLPARLEAEGLTFPLIVRPFGHQGGVGMTLVDNREALEATSFQDDDHYYFIRYEDYRDVDGYFRKYRMIFVDRSPHPYHLAISRHWLVHYFSADMLEESWKREEERLFLEHPAEVLGARATAAIEAIARRLDLDYAGIDFSILPDGRVLVFEANATMAVYFPQEAEYAYKTKHVEAILSHFEAMMERRIEAPRAPKPGSN